MNHSQEYIQRVFNEIVEEMDYEINARATTKKEKITLVKMLIAYLILTVGL